MALKKDEYLFEAGQVPKKIGFVLEGIFRFCFYNKQGNDITIDFVGEGSFITDYQKYELQTVATEYVQAATDCSVLLFTKKEWDDMANTIIVWESLSTKILKNASLRLSSGRIPCFHKMLPHATFPSSSVFPNT